MKSLFIILTLIISFNSNAQERSLEVKHEFKRTHPCPSNGKTYGPCPGYIVDHIKPLACGGEDATYNLQYQTKADSDAKDAVELQQCGKQYLYDRYHPKD